MNVPSQLPNLDKIFRDDDEPDFVSSGGSNLAAIFGLQSKLTDSQSNKQAAPRKDNTQYNVQQATPSSKTKVLIAKAVHVFKLQNGTYDSIGKFGMALTGNTTTRTHQIILYKNKQEYISVATVTRDFVYIIQTNNYASYYDNNKENWSILFENNDSYLEFVIEIGLARYFAVQERGDNVIYQDLSESNKDVVAKEGDSVSIKYFVGTEIVQPFKMNFVMSQTMTVEISADENWERILLGSGKGLKRILFLPPSKQISLGPSFPKERDIMMIIEITDVRATEKQHPPISKPSTSGKAAIISRMAKMGQSILPKIPLPSTTDSEDTEDDLPLKSLRHKRIEHSEAALQKNLQESSEEKRTIQKNLEPKTEVDPSVDSRYRPLVAASPLIPQWTPSYFSGHYVAMDNQIPYSVPQTVNRAVPAALDPGVNMLLSETRIANAEIRMGMSKMSDNVQKLLDKFHALELQKAAVPTTSDKTAIDASLAKMFLALNAPRAETNNEMPWIIDKNASDEKIQEAQNRISALESNLKKSNEEKESLLQINKDLDEKLQKLETKLTNVNNELKKTKANLEAAEGTIKQYKEEAILQNKLSKSEHLSKERAFQVDVSPKQEDIEKKNKEIKQIMNKTYHTLSERLASESRSELSFDYVKSTIANTIKHITLQVLYEDPEEEDEKSESSKNVKSTTVKADNQQIEEQIGKRILDSSSHDVPSTRRTETSRSTMIMPIFENEPPPVPPEGIDEIDSSSSD